MTKIIDSETCKYILHINWIKDYSVNYLNAVFTACFEFESNLKAEIISFFAAISCDNSFNRNAK